MREIGEEILIEEREFFWREVKRLFMAGTRKEVRLSSALTSLPTAMAEIPEEGWKGRIRVRTQSSVKEAAEAAAERFSLGRATVREIPDPEKAERVFGSVS